MTKNPLHGDWLVTALHDYEYSLAELHDGCGDLDKKDYAIDTTALCDYERNVSLFNVLRYYAYSVGGQILDKAYGQFIRLYLF